MKIGQNPDEMISENIEISNQNKQKKKEKKSPLKTLFIGETKNPQLYRSDF